jgi:hypothetical protein
MSVYVLRITRSRRAVCNVGIAALAISKGCGKRGKRLYVFLAFHQAVISTAGAAANSL